MASRTVTWSLFLSVKWKKGFSTVLSFIHMGPNTQLAEITAKKKTLASMGLEQLRGVRPKMNCETNVLPLH